MRPLSAVLGLTILIAIAGQASADANQAPAEPKFNMTGILFTGKFTIGGETTGVTLKTEHAVYELSMFGELARKAEALNGKKVHVIGTLRVVTGVEVKDRQIVAVESLSEVKPKGEDGEIK